MRGPMSASSSRSHRAGARRALHRHEGDGRARRLVFQGELAAFDEEKRRLALAPEPSAAAESALSAEAALSTGKATLLPGSFPALNDVATLLKDNPALRLDIEGYTDNTGNAEKNLKLSQSRADAVRAYLVKRTADAARMTATGFGQDNPIADNRTVAGRAKNRRVELKVSNQ